MSDGWVYYTLPYSSYGPAYDNGPKSLLKMKTDGSENQLLSEYFGSGVNVVGDWIYYHETGPSGSDYVMVRVKTDGSEWKYVNQ